MNTRSNSILDVTNTEFTDSFPSNPAKPPETVKLWRQCAIFREFQVQRVATVLAMN